MARPADVLALAEKANRTLAATEDLRGKANRTLAAKPRAARISKKVSTVQASLEGYVKATSRRRSPPLATIRTGQALLALSHAGVALGGYDVRQIHRLQRQAQTLIDATAADLPGQRRCETPPQRPQRSQGRAARRPCNARTRGSRRTPSRSAGGGSSGDDDGEPEPPRLVPRWQHGDSRPLAEAGR